MSAIKTILSEKFIAGLREMERAASFPNHKLVKLPLRKAKQVFGRVYKFDHKTGAPIIEPPKGSLADICHALRNVKNELLHADSEQLAALYVCAEKWHSQRVYPDITSVIGDTEHPGLLVLIKGEFLKRTGNSQAMFDALTFQYGGEDFCQIPSLANRPKTADSTKPDSAHSLLFRNNYREAWYKNKRVFNKARVCSQTSCLVDLHKAHTGKKSWLRWSKLKKSFGIMKDNPSDLFDRSFVTRFMDIQKISCNKSYADWKLRLKPTLEVKSS